MIFSLYLILALDSWQRLHSSTGRPRTLSSLLDDLTSDKINPCPVILVPQSYRRPPLLCLRLLDVDHFLADLHLLVLEPPEPQWRMSLDQAGVPLVPWYCERQRLLPDLSGRGGGGGGGGRLGVGAVRSDVIIRASDGPRQVTVIESLRQL